jgi:4-alpha-glucanotransferase
MLAALNAEGLLPEGVPADAAAVPEMMPALCRAVHAFLARTPSRIVMASVEDAVGERHQINLPGTVERYPNWSRKLALTLDELQDDPRPWELAAVLRTLRPPKATA